MIIISNAYDCVWHHLCSLKCKNSERREDMSMSKKCLTTMKYNMEGYMKKILFILMIMCFIPSFAFADEVDDGLPSDTPAQVKESARQVISLGIQNQGVINMTKTMLENKYTEKQMLAAHEVLMKAQKQNLDTEPIMNRFNESVAKKEKAANSIKAMEKVRSNYQAASGLAGKMTQDKEQVKAMTQEVAECMNAGITTKNMEQISTMLQTRTKDMKMEDAQALNKATLSTVKQMANAGAGSGSVSKVVKNAFEKGYTVRDMEKLGNTFMEQVKNASSAKALANSYANTIKNGATADNVGKYGQGVSGRGSGSGASGGSFGSGTSGSGSGTGSSGGGFGSGSSGSGSGKGGGGGRGR
jgi:hypothetical protein